MKTTPTTSVTNIGRYVPRSCWGKPAQLSTQQTFKENKLLGEHVEHIKMTTIMDSRHCLFIVKNNGLPLDLVQRNILVVWREDLLCEN